MFQYLYGNAVGVPETGAVTFGKDCVGNLHFAFDHEQVNAVLLAMQFVFLHQSRIQRTHREPGILVDGSRGGAVRRNHHSQLILLQNGADIIALIMRCCILLTREHPDLEEIQLLFTAIIELAMENPVPALITWISPGVITSLFRILSP